MRTGLVVYKPKPARSLLIPTLQAANPAMAFALSTLPASHFSPANAPLVNTMTKNVLDNI
jgi:hypothetical protein